MRVYRFTDTGEPSTSIEVHHKVSRRRVWEPVPGGGWGDESTNSFTIEVDGNERTLEFVGRSDESDPEAAIADVLGPEQGRTPGEQRAIDWVAEERGEEWAEEHAELILAQADLLGGVDDPGLPHNTENG